MKKILIALSASFLIIYQVSAQSSEDLLNADLSSLFDTDAEEDLSSLEDLFTDPEQSEESELEIDEVSVLDSLTTKTGYTFQVSYAFVGGMSPGWGEAPWNSGEELPEDEQDKYNTGFSNVFGADIGSKMSLDLQLTQNFRVKQVYAIRFPGFDPSVEEFWGHYNLNNVLYLRMGLQTIRWGLNRNYSYTNVLNRIPAGKSGGDSYSFLVDIPIGLGGLQFIGLARSGFVDSGSVEDLTASDVGYGAKYNIATQYVDLNLGSFFHLDMPVRTVASATTTLWDRTEIYAESLWSVEYKTFSEHTFSFSIGFFDSFFNDKLYINAEYYWNGEEDITYVDDDDSLIILDKSPFIFGHNIAWNLAYKPLSGSSLNLIFRGMYNINENTAKIIPGVRYKPLNDITLFLTVPMALGDRNGTYYRSNYDDKNRPFSVTLGVRLDGLYRIASYN